ncbi:MAG: ribonuclease HII [Verrucomicrobiales bacterium]
MPDLSIENEQRAIGFGTVAGVDEAGHGPLAGPVSAAAAVLPADFDHPYLNDSKKLSELRRESLYEEIVSGALGLVAWSSALATVEEIEEINILEATHLAMRRAVDGLPQRPDIVLIDGRPVKDFPHSHIGVIKGDSKSLSIAAASIVAKVERDRLMVAYAEEFPQYGFEKHKGYGTKQHLDALAEHGPCPIHRKMFGPVARVTG